MWVGIMMGVGGGACGNVWRALKDGRQGGVIGNYVR